MNKHFRSSKNLKQIPLHAIMESKEDPGYLKLKIKSLQEQIELLKKTNLNIFIPLSQKEQIFKDKQNKDEIIKKLRVQLLKQQQQSQGLRIQFKRLEKQKEVMKFNFENEIKNIKEELTQIKTKNIQLQEQNQELQNQYIGQKQKREEIQKQLIQLRVQLRFLRQDLQMYKTRYEQTAKNFNELKSLVLQVQFNSKIYKSNKVKITAIETNQLNEMRNCIFELQRQIQQLLWKLANPKKQQKIHLNLQTRNVAEQIVRLKKNIDMQLGFKGDDKVIKSFLDKYSQTNQRFKQLIEGCKAPINIIDIKEQQ